MFNPRKQNLKCIQSTKSRSKECSANQDKI